MKLVLQAIGGSGSAGNGHRPRLIQYRVKGLPPDREIYIGSDDSDWWVFMIASGIMQRRIGPFPSLDAAVDRVPAVAGAPA